MSHQTPITAPVARTLVSAALLSLAGTAHAQTCESPLQAFAGDNTGTTVGVTGTEVSPCGGGADTAAVWYVYTPTTAGPVEARTCGGTTNFNTTMSVVADSCAGALVGCSDNGCGIGSIVRWNAQAGQSYYIRVAGVGGATGTLTLRIIESAVHADVAIPLNANWNGIVHGDAERTLPVFGGGPPIGSTNENRANLMGFRAFGGDSSGSYAVALLSDPVFNTYTPTSTLPVGMCFDSYGPVGHEDMLYFPSRTTLAKDVVHIGDRSGVNGSAGMSFSANTVMWPSQGGTATTSNGYFPSWLDQYDHFSAPQTTSLASFSANKTFGPSTLIGLIYQTTNAVRNDANQKWPSIDVTLAFTDATSTTVTIYAPDHLFNNAGAHTQTPPPAPDSGVAVQRTLGLYWGMQGSDRALGSGPGRVRIAEAVISSASLQAKADPFNPVGKTLASISFGNPVSYTSVANMDAGITNARTSPVIVYAATLRDAVPALCPADLGQQGGVQGADGVLDNNDFVIFIDYFFNSNPLADLGVQGGLPGADGAFDNNDFVVFIDEFFAGCP
ncbi:MAG TPA: GC-type dockerin domain-anchored protein [Phycisphaerales bacterium]|nr:GC-type dockerin domain-anchored protein [Phycisphaerales bacterium]